MQVPPGERCPAAARHGFFIAYGPYHIGIDFDPCIQLFRQTEESPGIVGHAHHDLIQADSFLEEAGNRPRVGQAFLVIDPDALAGRRDYLERVEALVAEMLKDREVRLPGHRREALEARADVEGIDVSDALYAELMQLAA